MNSDQSFKDDWRVKSEQRHVKLSDRQRAIEVAHKWLELCNIDSEFKVEMALVARELINATERQDTADVGVIELPPFPFHREA